MKERILAKKIHLYAVTFAIIGCLFAGTASADKQWYLKKEQKFTFVDVDGIDTPIDISKIILTDSDDNRFDFEDGEMASIVRTPVTATKTPNTTTFAQRPTLFISIPGFQLTNTTSQADVDWPWNIDKTIASMAGNSASARYSQYRHFTVDWNSASPIEKQLDQLAWLVQSFLDNRGYPWDVVIIGHSRGGIFTHYLSGKLVGHKNLANLHTFLLDATAAPYMSDIYPLVKQSGSNYYCSFYYDHNVITGISNAFWGALGTVSDIPISGCDNYGYFASNNFVDHPHVGFGEYWTGLTGSNGLNWALDNVWAKKSTGTFVFDGVDTNATEVVRLRVNRIYISGNLAINNGQLTASGDLVIGSTSAGFNFSAGVDGVDSSSHFLVLSSQLQINSDHIAVASSNGVTSYSLVADNGTVEIVAKTPAVQISASISTENTQVNPSTTGTSLSVGGGQISAGYNNGFTNGSVEIGKHNVNVSSGVGIGVVSASASIGTSGISVSLGPVRIALRW